MEKLIFIVAGESSGDLHGSNLARALKALCPELKIHGLGGPMMKKAGVEIIYDLTSMAVIGFFEVLANIKKFKKVFNLALDHIASYKPAAVVLIDYPGFNLRLAAEIKKRNIPIIYYISPQVWAWGKKRIKAICQLVDRMIVVFEFEQELYRQHGLKCDFVGHPLLDMVKFQMSPEQLRRHLKIPQENAIISLMPGSRQNEVKLIMPVMLKAGQIIQSQAKKISFLLLASPYVSPDIFDQILKENHLPVIQTKGILNNNSVIYDCLNVSDLALVASGTATLEAAISLTPMAVIYRVNPFSWPLLKLLVKLPYISLVNIVAGRKIINEFLQYQAQPQKIATEALRILNDEVYRNKIREHLNEVKERLGQPGASHRAAEIIMQLIG